MLKSIHLQLNAKQMGMQHEMTVFSQKWLPINNNYSIIGSDYNRPRKRQDSTGLALTNKHEVQSFLVLFSFCIFFAMTVFLKMNAEIYPVSLVLLSWFSLSP